MKNLSLGLNLVLIIAVSYLYFLHFSKNKNEVALQSTDSTSTVMPIIPKEIKASKIVYVNADSLFSNYEFVKDLRKEAEGKQNRLESTYKGKAQKIQQDYMELQQKASNGSLSSDQAKVAEEDLLKRKAELDGMEKQLGILADENQQKNLDLQIKVNEYLKEYNKKSNYNFILAFTNSGGSLLYGSDSLDITNEILDGLNSQYKVEKSKKK